MNSFEKLTNTCKESLQKIPHTQAHISRLENELKEIDAQDMANYFLEIKDIHPNENNLLVPYLLGICKEFDINKEPIYEYGEFPDIDVDYISSIRTELKDNFSREQYGEDNVCNIATYTTFGLRSSLIDMAKVFDLDRKEILNLTTKLGIKDDEGEVLSWDKALELYDELREYLDEHPEMKEAAHKILNRNRNMGVHASGLIISGVPIKDFVPLVRAKEGSRPCSSWVEGLHGTDLGAVGLVKFDFLSLDGNLRIAKATKLVEESGRKVSALPGKSNWTDLSYLDDPKCMEMANKGDLKMIFQYDGSEGIRRLARQGGVTCFDDLTAYAAIFRPSTLKVGMHEVYCNRKKGKEKYEIHEALKDFMSSTYGVLVYQEQCLRMLNVVGRIPLKDCEAVRKAISKKKVDSFKKYKDQFIENGQIVLNTTAEEVEKIWNQIEAFAGYGFNLAHATAYCVVSARMLYLKVHHPLEFYTSILDSFNATGPKDFAKFKDYKQEVVKHGIKVNRVDINKSKFAMAPVNNEIYWGFSKLRTVGDEAGQRMEAMQPYKDYEDFLTRFGTDAKANMAVIALKLFPGDPETLYRYYESYKKWDNKQKDSDKRFERNMSSYNESIKSLIGKTITTQEEFEAELEKTSAKKQLSLYWKKINVQLNKPKVPKPTIDNFTEEDLNEDFMKILKSQEKCEEEFYGFTWDHPIEKAKFYSHATFEKFDLEENEIGHIDVMIKKVHHCHGPKATYYSLEVEDETSQTRRVTVWESDYKVFADLLKNGNFVRLRVRAPSNGFNSFTFFSYPRWKKPKIERDDRVFPLN